MHHTDFPKDPTFVPHIFQKLFCACSVYSTLNCILPEKNIYIIPHKNEGKTNPSRPQLLLNCPVQFGKSENKVWLCLSPPCLKKLLRLKQYQRLQGTQENHNSWQKFQFSWHKAINSAEKSDSNCNWLRVDKETRSANLKENLQTGKAVSDKGTKDSCTWWGLIQGKKKKKERMN